MKRTTIKALSLANRMMKWAYKNRLWSEIRLHTNGDVSFDCQAHSYRSTHSFKKEFKEVGTLKRFGTDTLTYTGYIKDVNLSIKLYSISILPPSCKIEYEEIAVPYQESVEAHTETVAKMVCGNGKKEAIPA